ncbi:hypothetical protein [Nocardia nepalensis]|uniref:hypothetical protein n=1 Tax=Nocardia nepalensis TaxID=3375448 RepID=UPI003B6735F0
MAAEHDQSNPSPSEFGSRESLSRGQFARQIGRGAVALAEAAVRTKALEGAAVFAIILMIFGAMSKYPAMTVLCLAAGLLGISLVVLALIRRWPIGRQWLVGVAVWAVDVSLIILTWRLGK